MRDAVRGFRPAAVPGRNSTRHTDAGEVFWHEQAKQGAEGRQAVNFVDDDAMIDLIDGTEPA